MKRYGYVQVGAHLMRALIGQQAMQEWPRLQASWDELPLDEYMPEGGTYRRRRLAVYLIGSNFVWQRFHQPHCQDGGHDRVSGAERRFAPVADWISTSALMPELLRAARDLFAHDDPETRWSVEIQQVRIEARPDAPGLTTPEALHRDGVDWVFMMTVARSKVIGGETKVRTIGSTELKSLTLKAPMESVLLDDKRVLHTVSPVRPQARITIGHQDVLVMAFSRTARWTP